MAKKTAIISGITGQDASYLAEFLLERDYRVVGLRRVASVDDFSRLQSILPRIELVKCDLLDQTAIADQIEKYQPDEFYNLSAQGPFPAGGSLAISTAEYNALGVTRILESVRRAKRPLKFFQASSFLMLPSTADSKEAQSETSRLSPVSDFGSSKAFGHFLTLNYRESYQLFACSGILFPHESPRRRADFLTKRIVRQAAEAKLGRCLAKLEVPDLNAAADWGFAGDYVKAMWLMLQQEQAEDYVIGSGELHSIKDWCETAFNACNLNWQDFIEPVRASPELGPLISSARADTGKAEQKLAWKAEHSFKQLVELMLEAEFARLGA